MRVALVHDDLVQWGGAERVLLGLSEIFPDAPIYTSVCDFDKKELKANFVNKKIVTSFLQQIPGWKSLYKALLPLYPIAFELFCFSDFDLVISHTTRFAKSIITKPKTKHICYCHTPPRFLWHFSGETGYRWLEPMMSKLRIYDQVSSRRVDFFIAGSENTKRRIKKVYKQDSRVVYPFIDLERFQDVETFDGRYFLVISRLNKYKRVDLAVEACARLGLPLKVIGSGSELDKLIRLPRRFGTRNDIHFLGNLSDEMVVEVLAGCKALIIPGIEDFGLTSLEAQALGKPVIAYREGGVLETVVDGKTGFFFNQQTVDSLASTLRRFNDLSTCFDKLKDKSLQTSLNHFNRNTCIANAQKFSKENFLKDFKQTIASLV